MPEVTVGDMFLRILAAFAAGFVVGWEREGHGRPAGLRTNILACVASAVAMLVSLLLTQQMAAEQGQAVRADVTRFGMGILTGIGFLGAGTILRRGDFVRGVTTAASLWFVTILGLAFGCGFFVLGALGLGVALASLLLLPRFERLINSDWYATLTVSATPEALSDTELRNRIEAHGPAVLALKLHYDVEANRKTLVCSLKCKRAGRFEVMSRLVTGLAQSPGVLAAGWD